MAGAPEGIVLKRHCDLEGRGREIWIRRALMSLVDEGKVALRRLGSDGQQVVTLDEAVRILTGEALPPDLARG